MLRPNPALLLILGFASCRADAGAETGAPPSPQETMQERKIPEELEVLAVRSQLGVSADGLRQLALELDVPTGGHELIVSAADCTLGEDGAFVATFSLTAPGNQELVTQAVETLSGAVDVPAAAERCEVRVRRWTRGWSYIVAPEAFVVAEHDVTR